ncbi:YfbU family protein [Glaciihabitans arcticus]|uniref:YfbU family protein n=1 Tax=Glaciihabitans arcticus TaxID=2668039 RepID=UPI00195DD0F8|nr:YfbU family protein [Glaciihabitans arcticus]
MDDYVRDALESRAQEEGVTLSEYVRELLREAVVPVWKRPADTHGDEEAPESIDFMDRKVLSLLHRILARVLPEDANGEDGDLEYQLRRAHVLEQGYTGEYWMEAAGFATELSKQDSKRVSDILQMFRILSFSILQLNDEGTPLDDAVAERLAYRGFDFNHPLEEQMASYVQHLVDDDKWSELKPFLDDHDGGNSHFPMLETYSRMLTVYRRVMETRERRHLSDAYKLSAEELQSIADERIHPSNR